MSGTFIEICPPRMFDFSNIQASAGFAAMSVLVAERINVVPWTQGSLVVRVHSVNIPQPSDSIMVTASPEGFTYEDPTAVFVASAATTVTVAGTTAPGFSLGALSLPFGAMLRIDVLGNRYSATTDYLSARLSLGLAMKF